MSLNRLKIDEETYNRIFEDFDKYIVYCDNLKEYFSTGYRDKHIIRVDQNTNTLIIQGYRLNTEEKQVVSATDAWQQLVCTLDTSLDGVKEVAFLPWANVANKKVYTVLEKYYDREIIETLLNACEDPSLKILHELLPSVYHDGKVHMFNNCVYYDINKAHTDALCEIFPKAKNAILKLDKNVVNIFVGDLCNHGHRGTYNWIVNRTRKKLEKILDDTGGVTIYVNTDGAIIYHPKNRQSTSHTVGDIKSNLVGDVVYAYVCKGDRETTTPYTIYQYMEPGKGVTLKGNPRYILRKGMDLSRGLVNKAKVYKDGPIYKLKNFRTEEVTVHEEK